MRLYSILRKSRDKRGAVERHTDLLGDPLIKAEFKLCHPMNGAAGFIRWCEKWAKVEDPDQNYQEVPFKLWEGQRDCVPDLVDRRWLIWLKNRRVGFTQMLVAYALWRIAFTRYYRVAVLNQQEQYAKDFIRKVKWMYELLPAWSRPELTKDNERHLTFEAGRKRCEIRSLVGGAGAARSMTGDLAIFDEADYIPFLDKTLSAITPAMTTAVDKGKRGQIILLTTTQGPGSEFQKVWDQAYGDHGELLDKDGFGPNNYKPVFIHWTKRAGRTETWREEQRSLFSSTIAWKREYPDNIDEAFEFGEDRVYPLFTRIRNVGTVEIPPFADRTRAVDWGDVKSAYVVLWIAHIPGPPGLLISPDCPNTIKELVNYRMGEDGRPMKADDHACDCLRYAVTFHNLTGLVFVYREVYRTDARARGYTPSKEIREIHELSGWKRAPVTSRRRWIPKMKGEQFNLALVADRALGRMISHMNEHDIESVASPTLKGMRERGVQVKDTNADEKMEGIRMVSELVAGTGEIDHFQEVHRDERILAEYSKMKHRGHVGISEEEMRIASLAKDLIKGNKARRRARRVR